jgi:hypothetical protein
MICLQKTKIKPYLVVFLLIMQQTRKIHSGKAKQEINMLGWVCLADFF